MPDADLQDDLYPGPDVPQAFDDHRATFGHPREAVSLLEPKRDRDYSQKLGSKSAESDLTGFAKERHKATALDDPV